MRGKPCIKPVVVWRARWWKSWMFTITPRLIVLYKVAVREWYRWVANKGSKKASGGTCLFLGCTAQLTGWRGLVQFAWCGRSWPSSCQVLRGFVGRDPSCFQGSTVAIVCRPKSFCPSVSFISFRLCSTSLSCHLFSHSLLKAPLSSIFIAVSTRVAEKHLLTPERVVSIGQTLFILRASYNQPHLRLYTIADPVANLFSSSTLAFDKMPSIRSLLFAGLQVAGFALAEITESHEDVPDVGVFRQLLGRLPEESIHAALSGHLGGKYQAGVFEKDHRAMEHIHKDNPSLASRLIEIAKHDVAVRAELRKRQDNSADNTTVIAVPSTSTSDDASTSTEAVIVTDSSTTSVSLTTETSSPSTTDAPTSTESSVAPSSTTGASSSAAPSTDASSVASSESSAAASSAAESSAEASSAESSTAASSESSIRPTVVAITTTNSAGSTIETSATATRQVAASSTNAESSAAASSSVAASTASGILVPVVLSSTNSEGSTVYQTTSAFQQSASVSVEQTYTTTNAQGSAVTTSARFPGVVVVTTNSRGSTVSTTSAVASVAVDQDGDVITSVDAPVPSGSTRRTSASDVVTTTDQYGNSVILSGATRGAVITTTDARGSTFITTYTPGGGKVSSLVLMTTTLADGAPSTVTSLAVVGGAQAATASSDRPSSTNTSPPGLQSGAASASRAHMKGALAVVGGALGFAYML